MKRITKIMLTAAVFAVTVVLTQESLAAGFKQGNDFEVHRISGNVYLTCTGGQTKLVRCDADLWTPGLTDYFVGPVTDADKVTLNSTRADGSQKSKDAKYDGSIGQSKSTFNLGINTLTQKPLLKTGENMIRFSLTKQDQVVSEGDFKATVVRGEAKFCPTGSDHAYGQECEFTNSICNRYFDRFNYCEE